MSEPATIDTAALFVRLAPWKERVEQGLAHALSDFIDDDATVRAPPRLREAMGYSLLAGGKRLRPLLTLLSARACAPQLDDDELFTHAMPAALALEFVHTYSLVHDDLPALDDDELRRGRPTLHKAFDEATAVLAGDALLTDAFALLARAPENAARQVRELALASGSVGMAGGQFDDVENEGTPIDGATLRRIHARKTGRLFVGACVLGGLSVGAPPERLTLLRTFAASFGVAFQIADDVLDVLGDVESAGKVLGRDAKLQKTTYVGLYGLKEAQRMAKSEAETAAIAARALGSNDLVELAHFAGSRRH
jgi:geranylgeranyl diphosphate synthase type II